MLARGERFQIMVRSDRLLGGMIIIQWVPLPSDCLCRNQRHSWRVPTSLRNMRIAVGDLLLE